jgi:hypothetical protein
MLFSILVSFFLMVDEHVFKATCMGIFFYPERKGVGAGFMEYFTGVALQAVRWLATMS